MAVANVTGTQIVIRVARIAARPVDLFWRVRQCLLPIPGALRYGWSREQTRHHACGIHDTIIETQRNRPKPML